MSNFICSECGMNNIDCGSAGYKTPREIELEKKLKYAINFIDCVRRLDGKCRPEECEVTLRVLKEEK